VEKFGAALRTDWMLDPAIAYLNHGTVGVANRRVLEHQRAIVDEIERHPARFIFREVPGYPGGDAASRIRQAAASVATFVGADPDGLVFVDNITTGANAVLRSFPFEHGDEIAVTDLGYGGIVNAARYAGGGPGSTLRTIRMPRPGAAPEAFVHAVADGLGPATRMLVIDHLTAQTALILPIAEIAELCRRRDILVLVDGAHVPGNIPLSIESLCVDFYAANLHKWAWAPRSCGLLWVAEEHRAVVHPTVVSWGLDHGFTSEFGFVGTRDLSPMLSAPFALDLLASYGVDDVMRHNHDTVYAASRFLAERWGVGFDTPESMIGSMAQVPLPDALGATPEDAAAVRAALDARDIEVAVHPAGDGLAVRISIQIYCCDADVERLADAIDDLTPN